MKVRDASLLPVAFQQITSLGTAVGITRDTSTKQKATAALLQAEAQNVRWRDDGTNPAAGVGHILYATGEPFLYTGDLAAIKFIEAAAGGKINITLYR